jgi:hypothetical protein
MYCAEHLPKVGSLAGNTSRDGCPAVGVPLESSPLASEIARLGKEVTVEPSGFQVSGKALASGFSADPEPVARPCRRRKLRHVVVFGGIVQRVLDRAVDSRRLPVEFALQAVVPRSFRVVLVIK